MSLRKSFIPAVLAIFAVALTGCAPDVYAHPDTPPPGQPTSAAPVEPSPVEPAPPSEDPTSEPTDHLTSQPTQEPPEVTEPVTSETPSAEPAELPKAVYERGSEGDGVRNLQHRLVQLDWYEGKIDGIYGEVTQLAVEGFQAKRGLPVLGFVDKATWDTLASMTREPTHDEMYNILKPGPALLSSGDEGDKVKDVQARLQQLDWYQTKIDGIYGAKTVEAVKGFQGKREIPVTGEVDQRTLDRLLGMTRKPTSDELNNVKPTAKPSTMTLDDRCLQGRVICISKKQRRLAWVIDGKVQMTMQVRFGSELTPTRNGVFSVYWKSKNHVSKLYKSPMPYALFFSGGQAVHYSSDFARRGYNGSSHGCVNVRDKAAVAALFDATREGDKVVVYG